TDLGAQERFERALAILDEADPLASTRVQETLGLAGAIYKYRWGIFAQRDDLERSLEYYQRGSREGVASDDGYTAINAAFGLDLLASQDDVEPAGRDDAAGAARVRRAEARRIREEIVQVLTDVARSRGADPWLAVTLAEACFGLGVDEDGNPMPQRYREAQF